jgi:hypothetical protein
MIYMNVNIWPWNISCTTLYGNIDLFKICWNVLATYVYIENIKHIVTTSSFCFIFRSKDYTEFKTFPQCNPNVADNDDVLSNTAIGMYWYIGVHRRNSISNNLTNFACLFWLESKISYDPMNNIDTWPILKCQLQMIYMNVNIWPWMSFMYFSCWFHYNSLEFHFQVTPLPIKISMQNSSGYWFKVGSTQHNVHVIKWKAKHTTLPE